MDKIIKKFKKAVLMSFMVIGIPTSMVAQSHGSHLQVSLGVSYPKTMEATLPMRRKVTIIMPGSTLVVTPFNMQMTRKLDTLLRNHFGIIITPG